jgi:hypothetical protein
MSMFMRILDAPGNKKSKLRTFKAQCLQAAGCCLLLCNMRGGTARPTALRDIKDLAVLHPGQV